MKKWWTSRTPIEQFQRCPRSRWWSNYACGTGLEPVSVALPLLVGICVHEGRAAMLTAAQRALDFVSNDFNKVDWLAVEEAGVSGALGEFSLRSTAIDREEPSAVGVPAGSGPGGSAGQGAGTAPSPSATAESGFDWASLGLSADAPEVKRLTEQQEDGKARYEAWFRKEQAALVEAMIRAYARRRLRPLLEQYEVLEVEREGEWKLSEWHHGDDTGSSCCTQGKCHATLTRSCGELWFASRPDALLRDRLTGDLVIDSLKTAASWDRRKALDAQHDMQGLSEGVEVEQRLGRWWELLHLDAEEEVEHAHEIDKASREMSQKMIDYLSALPAPPRILAIRMDYVLKGERWVDDTLSAKFGFEVRSQRSKLVSAYLNAGMVSGDESWCTSWDYVKEDGATSKLNYRQWKRQPVWEHMSVRAWVDMLERGEPVVAEEGREVGWHSDAQAVGYLERNPLDECFVPPILVYRNDDELRDWLEQVEAQEVAVAQHVEEVREAEQRGDDGEVRHLLNLYFPQTRRACQYPTTCAYCKEGRSLCFGGDDLKRDPLGSGYFKPRELNHPEAQ